MASIIDRKQDVVKRFQHFKSWDDRYRQLIHYGKKLAPMAEAIKTPNLLVPGCVSKVWLHHEHRKGKIFFQGDSDASITKGIIGILLYVYSGATPKEITQTPANFLEEIGLHDHLSTNRRNGLANMARLIHDYGARYYSGK